MANTKTRSQSKKKNKDDKLSTGKKNKAMTLEVAELDSISASKKKKKYMADGHLVENKKNNKMVLKKGSTVNETKVGKTEEKLLSKGGKLKRIGKNIQYMDSILMSELLISKNTALISGLNTKLGNGDNNNDTDLSDQNNRVNSTTNTAENEKTMDTNGRQNSDVTNAVDTITVDTNVAAIISTDDNQRQAKKKKIKRHTKKTFFENFDKHLKQKERNIKLRITHFECDHCPRTFSSKSSLIRHMLMHLNLRPYACSYCKNRKFRQRSNWRIHMAKTHPEHYKIERTFLCRICRKQFHLKEHLRLHQKAHEKARQKRYHCVFCEKVFKCDELLTQHEKQHMEPGRYKCSMCTKSYDSRLQYSEHLKTHVKVKNYDCPHCGKIYLRPSSIARHIRVNHGGMRMQCKICNKLLRGHLTEHMRTHEKQRPHECELCGQKFTQSTQLTVHKRSHSGVRPYSCRICKQPFSHSNALMLHIRRHTGEKPFGCAMCPQTFSQLPHMKAHMRNIHRKTEFYKCNNCDLFFKLKVSLEAHAEVCEESEGSVATLDKTEEDKEATSALVSRIRFLLALLFTMIASKEKLYDLGFNKRLIDDILVDSIEAMGLVPCKDLSITALSRLKINVLMLLRGTVPKQQMDLFDKEKKSTEELLELLTDEHYYRKVRC